MSSDTSFSGERSSISDSRLFLLAALPAFALYFLALAPTVTGEDSGELISAAYTLGIAHPPGYPLWCILGKVFTLIPLGTVAWRINLLSATLGAGAVGILALIARRLTRSAPVALLAAMLFAGSRDFFSQSVVAEVYTLNVLIFLLLLYLVLRFEDTDRTRWLYLAAFCFGLGLTNHSTLMPLGPVFFGWVFLRRPCLILQPVLLMNLLAAALIGFSLILYLPVRSVADPFVDWGNPETISAALDHFLRRQYRAAEVPMPRTIIGQAVLVVHFLETFSMQFTPVIAALAIPGALIHRQRERASFVLFFLLFGLTSYGFIWLLNYPPDRENLHLTRVFFLPANAIGAIWISMALKTFCDCARWRFPLAVRELRLALAALGALIAMVPAFTHLEANDQSRNFLAEDWGRNILRTMKPDSIIIPSSDHSTFPLIYLQAVEGLRPDVLVADKYGYIDERVFAQLFSGELTPRAPPPPPDAGPFEKERYLIEHSGRPVYFTTKHHLPGLDGWEMVSTGLIYQAVRKGGKVSEAEERAAWASYRFHPGSLERPPEDFQSDLILADYHFARGRRALQFGAEKEALEALRLAARYGRGIKEIQNNLGGTLAEAGKPELAIPFLLDALAIDPGYDLATRNLVNACFTLKRYRDGLPHFERLLGLDPGEPLALLGKARAHKALGERLDAFLAYGKVFELDPGNQALWEEFREFTEKAYGKDSPYFKSIRDPDRRPLMPGGAIPDFGGIGAAGRPAPAPGAAPSPVSALPPRP